MTSPPHVHITAGRVIAAAGVTTLAAILEMSVAWMSGSLFLVADSVHLVAHLGIFTVLLLPLRGSHEGREDVATTTVLVLVIAVAGGIAFQSVSHLLEPGEPPRPEAMLVSLLGLAANLITAWLFRHPARERWSFRAALAHELSDASLTVAGLLGALAIALYRFPWVDPGLSLAVAIWLGAWATRLIVRRVLLGRAAWEIENRHASR
ncbi:MAG TPA: cation transporter [Candidatus Dormibacteraeota bacterium]|nr:cation transporter [Candidatus Dormibacteraeota bacterium]